MKTTTNPDQPPPQGPDAQPRSRAVTTGRAVALTLAAVALAGAFAFAYFWRDWVLTGFTVALALNLAAMAWADKIHSRIVRSEKVAKAFVYAFMVLFVVGSAGIAVYYALRGDWDVAAYHALISFSMAWWYPVSNRHAPDVKVIIDPTERLDERRQQISLKARAMSFELIMMGALITTVVSLLVNTIGEEHVTLWWPSVALFGAGTLLRVTTVWFYSRRM